MLQFWKKIFSTRVARHSSGTRLTFQYIRRNTSRSALLRNKNKLRRRIVNKFPRAVSMFLLFHPVTLPPNVSRDKSRTERTNERTNEWMGRDVVAGVFYMIKVERMGPNEISNFALGVDAAEDWLVDHDPTRDSPGSSGNCISLCLYGWQTSVLRCEWFVSTGSGSNVWCVVREDHSSRDYSHLHIPIVCSSYVAVPRTDSHVRGRGLHA